MNNVILIGRLTKEPELNETKGGLSVCKFTLAVNRMKKDDPTDFINCVSFGKTAELIANYVRKGKKLGVVGRIQTGKYTNKEGNVVYTTDILVNQIEFLESAGEKQTVKETKQEESVDNSTDSFPF